ncbi:hypothetical protein NGG16_03060 [Enterococcus casseliflavus]|uniref:hypothetical protein n=1 Tax=Enterococcus casseliflavus TaxID=37734 RepID=UPI002DB8BE86|nr:hypothetical protein [Enterococcus casseliflavus]MEB8416414.1 hypothetical protein [Enterococcus casseliflavus]
MKKNQMNHIEKWIKISVGAFVILFLVQLFFPTYALADIQSSVNNAGNSITKLVRNVTAAIGTAIIAGGFLANMMPIMEVSQKAKMIIIRAGVSILGISFAAQLVDWIMAIK